MAIDPDADIPRSVSLIVHRNKLGISFSQITKGQDKKPEMGRTLGAPGMTSAATRSGRG